MKKILFLFLFSMMLSGCAFDSTYHPDWIFLDAPLDDFEAPVGSAVPVRAHSDVNYPAMQMIIEVNGVGVGNLSVSQQSQDPPLYVGTGSWTILSPGDYHLRVRLQSGNSDDTTREVRIRAYLQPTVAPLMPATTEPGLSVSPLPPQLPALPTYTLFPTLTVPPSPTPLTPIEINFWANEMEIAKGSCTFLHWEVKHASLVTLNNGTVAAQGKQKVCPSENITYALRAQNAGENVERSLVIKVTAPAITVPADTSGPVIQQIQSSYQKIYWPSDCSPAEVVISAMVNDASGVKSVSLFYRVVDGKRQGEWREKKMNLTSTNTYAITLLAKDFQASLNPPVESGSVAGLQYYILAIDSLNNRNQSKPYADIELDYCLY
jgi:hypothetical protein